MKSPFPRVYIIVLNYKNAEDTNECLTSLQKLNYPNYHVVVVDNASNDNSESIINSWIMKSLDSRFTFVQAGRNNGYAGGNNVGIKYAQEKGDMDYIWILNNDTIVDEQALDAIISKFKEDKSIGMCGSKIVSYWDRVSVQGYGAKYNKYLSTVKNITKQEELSKINYIIGASLCLSREFLEQVGLFSEDYFLYYEELDLVERSKGKFTFACAVDSIVYHKEGATTGGNKSYRSELSDFYMIRNRIIFTRKYHPLCLLTVYLGIIYSMLHRIFRGQSSRAFMILKIMFNPNSEYVSAH
ncbi:MAG: glycosyltransferase family 2 protein [Acidaminococcus sp.]|jgi:GT2 family glycosyltransferase|nr:glycosyltransferase family 2 protein [Acidaminococcus sp.]MCI2116453.1 glycosyltransferase family 2 protein [Acidaminococcus sp.]